MPSGLDHPAHKDADKPGIYKGLHVGESGTGKTGMLASLLDAGYKLRVLDFDAGLDPLIGYAKKRALLANLSFITLRDEFKLAGSYLKIEKAPSFQRAMAAMADFEGHGPVQSWGADTVFIIDTLGSMAQSSFNMVLQANGVVVPSGQRGGPEQSHYGTAMDNIKRLLETVTNPTLVPCHVIVNAHWTYQEAENGLTKAYPETIGNKLSPKVARDFNNLYSVSISPNGARTIKVKKDRQIACKSSRPLSKEEYPIETGMADIFREIVGPPPK